MAYCANCLHKDVCKSCESCCGRVPGCELFIDRDALAQKFDELLGMLGQLREQTKIQNAVPTVDAVEVEDPKMREAIKMLVNQYSKSKQSGYVHNPLAHAFYYTWKELDERPYKEKRGGK